MPMQLTVENLSKNYRGGLRALNNVNLTLRPGVLAFSALTAPENPR